MAKPDFEFVQNNLELAQSQMMFATFQAMQGRVAEADLFGELRIRQTTPHFSQVSRELLVQIPTPQRKVPKLS